MKKLFLALIMCVALAGTAAAVVNINTASKEELTTIKGIGDKRAQEIIDYRKKNGDFKSVDELEWMGPTSAFAPLAARLDGGSRRNSLTTAVRVTKPIR